MLKELTAAVVASGRGRGCARDGMARSADIWSVGCTVVEMATSKPPWNQFSQEVTAIFHIASAKEAPKPPVWMTLNAQDFMKQCMKL